MTTTADTPPTTAPEPLLAGTFALYLTPGQDIVIAYRPTGADIDQQLLIPGFVVQMATQAAGRDPAALLTQLQGGIA